MFDDFDALDVLLLAGAGALLAYGLSGASIFPVTVSTGAPALPPQSPAPALPSSGASSLNPSVRDPDLEAMWRTMYGEARGEPAAAQQGVASVILNRAHLGTFPGGSSVAGVCHARLQFDCWISGTRDYAATMAANPNDGGSGAECYSLARAMLDGEDHDNTGGATFYHDTSLSGPPKAWGAVVRTVQMGRLVFYRGGAAAGAAV